MNVDTPAAAFRGSRRAVRSGLLFTVMLVASLLNSSLSAAELPGLAVGHKAPGFALKDQNGKEHSLDEFLKQGKVALVFYRSADW